MTCSVERSHVLVVCDAEATENGQDSSKETAGFKINIQTHSRSSLAPVRTILIAARALPTPYTSQRTHPKQALPPRCSSSQLSWYPGLSARDRGRTVTPMPWQSNEMHRLLHDACEQEQQCVHVATAFVSLSRGLPNESRDAQSVREPTLSKAAAPRT